MYNFSQTEFGEVGKVLNAVAAVETPILAKTNAAATTPPTQPITPKAIPAAEPEVI